MVVVEEVLDAGGVVVELVDVVRGTVVVAMVVDVVLVVVVVVLGTGVVGWQAVAAARLPVRAISARKRRTRRRGVVG